MKSFWQTLLSQSGGDVSRAVEVAVSSDRWSERFIRKERISGRKVVMIRTFRRVVYGHFVICGGAWIESFFAE